MTLNISKRNPLNQIYNYWLSLGGEPKTPEDLCHFMRVCFLWSWVRWLFSFDFEITERVEQSHGCYTTSHYHDDRVPRVVHFMIAMVFIVLGTELYARGVVLTFFMVVAALTAFSVFVVGFVVAIKTTLKFFEDGDIHEGLRTFRDYSAAKKQRICPFIKVE